MKFLLMVLLVTVSNTSFANDCTVADYDQYQDRPLSKQVKRILKKKGYKVVNANESSSLTAGESCASSGEDDYCTLVIFSKETGSLISSGEHREGRAFWSLYREALRGNDYSKIKSCNKP